MTLKTLAIDELQVGMYVKDIMLKNSNHKVKNQGKVNSERTIALLKKQGVAKVVIDIAASDHIETSPTSEKNVIDDQQSVEEEFTRSCQIYDEATENVKQLLLNSAMNKPLSPESMNVLAGEITASILRNEHAITILTRIRQKSHYQWEHAINCGVLICGFGLYLGLKKETVQEMTLGALLHDIGTAKVPNAIIGKIGELTTSEMNVVKKHVFWGIDLAKREGFASPVVIDMLVNHHERLDGSGYPRGLKKNKLSTLSRMTSIIDVYDAMTGDRPHKQGQLPMVVLRHLLTQKDKFDQELVQKFIKYIGVHPVGSLVELNNEKIAIVMEGNRIEPLKPKVKVVFSLKLNQYVNAVDLDLTESDVAIVATVHPDDYQININKLIRDLVA